MNRSGMTEYDSALRDLRADAIDEVADSMPEASAKDVVAAIVKRLDRGLPTLVAVDLEVRP